MYLHGKSLYEKSVCINPRHRKFNIMFLFDDSSQSEEFYHSFNYREKGLFFRRIAIFLCRHKNKYELDVGHKTHHYTYCPDCKMALFVDDETEEDKKQKRKELELKFEKEEIMTLSSEVKMLRSRLARREKLLSTMEAEYADKLENTETESVMDTEECEKSIAL